MYPILRYPIAIAAHAKILVLVYGDGSIESFHFSNGLAESNGDLRNSTATENHEGVTSSVEVVAIMTKHPAAKGCPVVFRSPQGDHICSSSFIHDVCKAVAKRSGLDSEKWHMHRFRDTAATRWLRAGSDVRTVQVWLGHESLATTQEYLEPSKETEKMLDKMKLSV